MLSPLAASIYGVIGLAGTTGLGIGGFAYASRWPTSQIFGRTLIAPRIPSELALTFDDGPNPAWTPRLLDILAEHNVQATFFMVGKFAKSEAELARRVADAGHLIGNHTWSHPTSRAPGIRQRSRRTHPHQRHPRQHHWQTHPSTFARPSALAAPTCSSSPASSASSPSLGTP